MSDSHDVGKLAEAALELVKDGNVVGLGTGRAASHFVESLAVRVRGGLHVRGVATSIATATLAQSLGIPLATLEEIDSPDITVDGADEVDPHLNLIKGLGGALLREKILASAARRLIILVGSEKLVPILGAHGTLPLEVTPFARDWCRRQLAGLGYAAHPRLASGVLFVTDNGNNILDCAVSALSDPAGLQRTLRSIPGILETGLFLGMADTVLIQSGNTIETRKRV